MALAEEHHKTTLSLFASLVCDRDLFTAVFGADPANPTFNKAAFAKYIATWNDPEFVEPLAVIEKHRVKAKQAQNAWFDLVGADYTGPACPTEQHLKSIVVSITL